MKSTLLISIIITLVLTTMFGCHKKNAWAKIIEVRSYQDVSPEQHKGIQKTVERARKRIRYTNDDMLIVGDGYSSIGILRYYISSSGSFNDSFNELIDHHVYAKTKLKESDANVTSIVSNMVNMGMYGSELRKSIDLLAEASAAVGAVNPY
ncbi:MAG: hypothetical protein PHY48_02390 [Candidatus Cloacimonetes bacterium]|nr:hypothetical protein [Candidatus Cloacimonadota bacterium]